MLVKEIENDNSKALRAHTNETKLVQVPSVEPDRPALHFFALCAESSLRARLEKQA